MKTTISLLLILSTFISSAQLIATVEVKEPIPGVCNNEVLYALISVFEGQKEATCPLSDSDIEKRLNAEVGYVSAHPKHKDKGMISLVINCRGELVQCKMDNKTKDPELDAQIVAV